MDTFDIVFYAFAAITVLSAFVVVFSRNIMYAAFSLLFTFFGVAGLYVLLQADFLAVTQILIYVGGILVLLLFGVMLTNKVVSVDIKTGTIHTIPAMILAAIVFFWLFRPRARLTHYFTTSRPRHWELDD
jgi:NADH-quinone oxidoreductase subunit J